MQSYLRTKFPNSLTLVAKGSFQQNRHFPILYPTCIPSRISRKAGPCRDSTISTALRPVELLAPSGGPVLQISSGGRIPNVDLEASSLPRSCHLQVSVFLYHTPAEERADCWNCRLERLDCYGGSRVSSLRCNFNLDTV